VRRVKRIGLFAGDKCQPGRRGPAHESSGKRDVVIVVSPRNGHIFRVSRPVVTRSEHHTAEKIALQLEVGSQAEAETPPVTLNYLIHRTEPGICQNHRYALIPLIPDSKIAT